jgi:hypothetical protein
LASLAREYIGPRGGLFKEELPDGLHGAGKMFRNRYVGVTLNSKAADKGLFLSQRQGGKGDHRVSNNDRDKVISIRDKLEMPPDQEVTKNSILSFTTFDGVTQQKTKVDVLYIGVIYTIPADDYQESLEAWDIKAKSLFKTLRSDKRDLIPIHGGQIERYDVFDANKTNVHIMYRLPYMPKPIKAS